LVVVLHHRSIIWTKFTPVLCPYELLGFRTLGSTLFCNRKKFVDVHFCIFPAARFVDVEKTSFFLKMDPVPPVVDVSRQVRIETPVKEAIAKSLFSPLNVTVALVVLLVLFFLYKRYRDKKATETAHVPSPVTPPK
jgi:hypothetical protein